VYEYILADNSRVILANVDGYINAYYINVRAIIAQYLHDLATKFC